MSDNLDPVELQILLNSGDVERQTDEVNESLAGVDAAMEKVKEGVIDYVKSVVEGTNPLRTAKQQDAAATMAQEVALKAYNVVVGSSTGALKAFRIALASTGIGAIILLVVALAANWEKLTGKVKEHVPALNNLQQRFNAMKSYVMGFLNAYLAVWSTVYSTILKLVSLDFKGAWNAATNLGANVQSAYNSGFSHQQYENEAASLRKSNEQWVTKAKRELEIRKAAGENTVALERTILQRTIGMYKEGTQEYMNAVQEKAVFEAKTRKDAADATKKAADNANKARQKQLKEERELEEKAAEEKQRMLDRLAEYEREVNRGGMTELQKKLDTIKGKYEEFKRDLERSGVKLSAADMQRLNAAEGSERNAVLAQHAADLYKAEKERNREALDSAQTYQEKLYAIEVEFGKKKFEINKTQDQALREAKLQELEYQKREAIDATNAEAFERTQIYERLSANLMGITKRELENRIASLKEFLSLANLTPEQRKLIEGELGKAEGVMGGSDIKVKENVLLAERKRLTEEIAKEQAKGNEQVVKLQGELEAVNRELADLAVDKFLELERAAHQVGAALGQLGGAIGTTDSGIGDTISGIGEMVNIAGDAAGAVGSFMAGDILGGVTKSISAITGVINLSAKARESEKKALEEIKAYQDELFKGQLAAHEALRNRLVDEAKLNDLYQSRVDILKEEQAVNEKNKGSVESDMQAVWKRLLGSETVTGMHTKKTWFGLSTKTVEDKSSIANLLGISKATAMTDELLRKLEQINATKPLTGDAKEAYDTLIRLRDEYGSIEAANRELEKQMRDSVTGTTAQALGDSIREGILSGKKDFKDFAGDIEEFLRQGIIRGMDSRMIEPQMQKLQDQLYAAMGDGVLTDEEKAAFQAMYMKIVGEAKQYAELMEETSGISLAGGGENERSLKGAIKGMNEQKADLLAGQLGGMRLAQLTTNELLKASSLRQFEDSAKMIELTGKIELNTRNTADNTKLTADGVKKIFDTLNGDAARASGR